MAWSSKVTELLSHKMCSFQPIYQRNRVFSKLMLLAVMDRLCVIKVRKWPYLTSDIAFYPLEGHLGPLDLPGIMFIYILVVNFFLGRGALEVLRSNMSVIILPGLLHLRKHL